MDPITSGAIKSVQHSFVQEAEQSIQKANQQVSDFEKLREKLEQHDAVNNPAQLEAMDKMNQTPHASQVNQVNQIEQNLQVQQSTQVPEIKNLGQMEAMVNDIRHGQSRLNQILSEATSGRTYSPAELIALQAEVGKITEQLSLATKVVENFVSSVKTTLNLQL